MKTALIGHTGFVGKNLLAQAKFTDKYNSQNINDIKGKKYDLIVSAGTPALRWKANKEPKEDWENIKMLLNNISYVSAKRFILISTVDVYPKKNGVDEDTPIKLEDLKEAYGKNRFKMELFIKSNFPRTTICRYPQLYGKYLKKNFIYDLINNNALDFTHKDTKLQLYHLKNIWRDIQIAIDNNLQVINFATEPVSAKEIAKYSLNMDFDNETNHPPMTFDFRTKHGGLYGSEDSYIYHKDEILSQVKDFIKAEK